MNNKVLSYKQNIKSNSNWVSHYLIREGFHLDYSMDSLDEIERLFEHHNYIILDETSHNYLFAISCYIGDVLVKHYKSKWIDNDYCIIIKNKKIFPYEIVNELLNNKKDYLNEVKNILDNF